MSEHFREIHGVVIERKDGSDITLAVRETTDHQIKITLGDVAWAILSLHGARFFAEQINIIVDRIEGHDAE